MEGEFRPLTDHIEQPSERLRNRAEWAITHAATTTHARQEIAIYKPIPVIRSRRIGSNQKKSMAVRRFGMENRPPEP